MITATLKGRVETKVLTYGIAAITAAMFAMVTTPALWAVFGLAMVVGILLETIWGAFIEYQPGWLTIVLGAVEYLFITAAIIATATPVTFIQATLYFWITWLLVQLFLIYILPIVCTDWADRGHEIF